MTASKTKLSQKQQELLRKRLAQRRNRIPKQPHQGSAPASLTQSRLWLEYELIPHQAAYNITRRLQLNGRLPIPILKKSIDTVVARHEALRTTFALQGEQIMQQIQPALDLPLPVQDLMSLSGDEQADMVAELEREEAKRPFDLSSDPLIRFHLLRLAEEKYILLFTLHHIIADGWSMTIFLQELGQAYQAFVAGKEPALPTLPIQYADFAYWQTERLQSPALQKQQAYWLKQLENLPASLDLPTDHPRPAQQTYNGALTSFTIPAAMLSSLKALGQAQGCTLFMTLLAAFQLLLARYSGQTDIAVGSPVAGRSHPDVENLIGFFVNTIVLRARLEDNPSFIDLLAQTRQVVMEALSNQELPFVQLVSELKPDRNLDRPPLFQVMFALQNLPETTVQLPGLTNELQPVHSGTAKYDLSLFTTETADGITCTWEYNTDLFDPPTIQQMSASFKTLLMSILAAPQQPVMTLPLLDAQARQQQLMTWNDTRVTYPENEPVHHLFEVQAAMFPDRIALVFESEQISYADLNRRANQLARALQNQGVGPETLVGLCLARSVEMVVGILAILKAGGAYLPLDAAYPPERLALMLKDGAVSLVLTQASLRDSLPLSAETSVLCLDSEWGRIASEKDDNLGETAVSTNLAYVMYTSGSTGLPKGVAVTHQNIVRLVKGANFALLTPEETFLQYAPISFDAATLEIWGSLLNGARLVIAPPHQLSVDELTDLIQTENITTLWLTSGLFHLVVDDHLAGLSGLHQLLAGGDVLSLPRVQRVLQELPDCQLINGYGPTENTTFTTCHAVSATDNLETSVPIGKPVSNTQVYVLDSNLELVPVGVPGELYTGGDGLARGYLNQAGLTAVSFIPHPFATRPGERLYRTGDWVRWLPDGMLQFLGRRDNQVKIRGYRIELGEIEAVLTQHADVRQGVVLARTSVAGSKYLAGYVLPENGEVEPEQLKLYVGQHLPDYMVPTAWVMLDEMPLNANGKIDRTALPEPDLASTSSETGLVLPITATENTLAQIWADVLGLPSVGIHDNFFELGGDSILSIRIAAKAKEAGLPVTIHQIFHNQTIATLAADLDLTQKTAVSPTEIVLQKPTPLTPIQHWFFEQSLAQPHHWNMAMLLEPAQPLQKEALAQAVDALVAHHDALRLQFVQTESGWQQQYIAHEDGRWLEWLTNVDDLDEAIAAQQASLHITNGPMFRAAYFDRGDESHRLLLVAHHLVVDGISWRILFEDLQTAYAQAEQKTAVILPSKTTSFLTWADALSGYAASDTFVAQVDDWPDAASAPLPLDIPSGNNTVASETILSYTLPQAETQALLQEVPAAYNTRVDDLLLTALVQAYADWTGQNALLLHVERHGREEILPELDITRTVGWFTTMAPVLLELSAAGEPGEDLKAIKEQMRQIPDHGLPYGLLRFLHPDAGVRDELAERETAVISFNYLGQFNEQADGSLFRMVDGASASLFAPENQRAHILDISGYIRDKQLRLSVRYSRNLHHAQSITRFGDAYFSRLQALIKHCQSPEAQGYTPSDFDKINLSQNDLDDILAELDDLL